MDFRLAAGAGAWPPDRSVRFWQGTFSLKDGFGGLIGNGSGVERQDEPPSDPDSPKPKSEWMIEIEGEMEMAPDAHSTDILPIILTVEQVREMISSPALVAREQLMIRVLYASALRADEFLAMRFADLVDDTIQVGGDYARTVVIDELTAAALRGLGAASEELVFPGTFDDLVELVRKAASPVVRAKYAATNRVLLPKALRHAYASHRLERGMDLFVLWVQLGHRYMDTTEMYLETAVGRWRNAYNQHHPLARQR